MGPEHCNNYLTWWGRPQSGKSLWLTLAPNQGFSVGSYIFLEMFTLVAGSNGFPATCCRA